ncbi:hypothetical protein GDO86_013399 [Hymenochirus boettgeri]|uniref:Uncharacterized protein n=1 Tax=Hymenochirus boettgeri TaxID=247094 RepID=A0A8T2IZ85_9PIPI|nr:hypothetical protein GDO86_013399 [Hymenochirus boettgeri]
MKHAFVFTDAGTNVKKYDLLFCKQNISVYKVCCYFFVNGVISACFMLICYFLFLVQYSQTNFSPDVRQHYPVIICITLKLLIFSALK